MDAREAKEKLMDAVRATSPLQTQRQYLGMSQIGRCPRLQYQWFMDGKVPDSDRMYLNAISGYMYEAKVRELLITAGVVVRNQYSQGPVASASWSHRSTSVSVGTRMAKHRTVISWKSNRSTARDSTI